MTLDDLVAKVTDPYERLARLYPALLALLPLFVLVMLLYGPKATSLSGAVTVAVSCGGLYLTTNLCRELGKRLEESLYQQWGGRPSTQLLRHRDKTIEAVTKRRYHSFLAAKINEAFPDKDQEAKNPEAADDVYRSGVRWLLNHTRPDDGKKFDLLFRACFINAFQSGKHVPQGLKPAFCRAMNGTAEAVPYPKPIYETRSKENVAYGFRRNALGMKPIGLIVSIGSLLWVLVTEGALFAPGRRFVDLMALSRMPQTATASLIVSAIMVVAWILFFTKASARAAAFTYAEALLRACDIL